MLPAEPFLSVPWRNKKKTKKKNKKQKQKKNTHLSEVSPKLWLLNLA